MNCVRCSNWFEEWPCAYDTIVGYNVEYGAPTKYVDSSGLRMVHIRDGYKLARETKLVTGPLNYCPWCGRALKKDSTTTDLHARIKKTGEVVRVEMYSKVDGIVWLDAEKWLPLEDVELLKGEEENE